MAVDANLVVQVRRRRASGRADEAHAVAAVAARAGGDERLLEVAIERCVAVAVTDRDRLAVLARPTAVDDDAVRGREHRLAARGGDVEAVVAGGRSRERIRPDA